MLVETFLPGREFTVGITGTGEDAEVLGVIEVIADRQGRARMATATRTRSISKRRSSIAWRTTREAKEAAEVALAAWRALRCRDGGRVDIRYGE